MSVTKGTDEKMYELSEVRRGGVVVGRAPTPQWPSDPEEKLEAMVEILGSAKVAKLAEDQLISTVENKVRTRKDSPSAEAVVRGILNGQITAQQVADEQEATGLDFTKAGCKLLGITAGAEYIGWAELTRAMR